MKKFYSIAAALLLTFANNFQATAQDCPANSAGTTSRDASKNECKAFVNSSLIGASIRVFDANGVDVTIGTGLIIASDDNPAIGAGVVRFQCSAPTPISVRLISGAQSCPVTIAFNITLPIKLGVFAAAVKSESSVQLNWTSVLEANSSHFGVEKSADGKNFTAIGSVKAAGNSTNTLNYSFADNSFAGTAYYRLKLVDLDGKSEYSKVIYVNGGSSATGTLSVFPNPFRSDVQLKGINASDVNKNNIRIFSASGKEVSFKITGSNSISIDPAVPQGVYMLRVKGQVYKLVKE